MAFEQTKNLDAMLSEMSQMAPGDLEELLGELQGEKDEIPDGHLVNYMDECIRESYESSKDRRSRDDLLWSAHETELDELNDKEDWQSQIVLNKPFTTVIQAKALVRKGLMERPDFFEMSSIGDENELYRVKADFWTKAIKYWARTKDADFANIFADSAEMGFAVGQSMATKILWKPDHNGVYRLELINIEPWKTWSDPDRTPRKPWSGLFNIHEEWVDFHELKDAEAQGRYQNIDQVRIGRSSRDGAGYGIEDKEEERRRKRQTFVRNKYRKSILVREFWGTILDENGDIKMPNASFTVANGVVIRKSRPNPFKRLRWPWVDFCPIPHIINFHGYGVYESVLALWKFQNNLMNLYIDNENWRINNMFEMFPDEFVDGTDNEVRPGKIYQRKRGSNPSTQGIRPVLKGDSAIQDVKFMWDIASTLWENGSFVTEVLKGGHATRRQVTAKEVDAMMQQSIGVFDSFAKDIEQGGTNLLWAIKEVLTTFWDDTDKPGLKDVFGDDPIYKLMSMSGALSPEQRINALELDCEIEVGGVSRLFRKEETIKSLKEMAVLGSQPQFARFPKNYEIFRKIAREINMEENVKTPEEIKQEVKIQTQGSIAMAKNNAMRAAEDHLRGVKQEASAPAATTGGQPNG